MDYDNACRANIQGNQRFKKNLGDIVAAHEIPYYATLSIGHPLDFIRKVEKAKNIKGFRFLHMFTPCIPGWKMDPAKTVEVTKGQWRAECGLYMRSRMR